MTSPSDRHNIEPDGNPVAGLLWLVFMIALALAVAKGCADYQKAADTPDFQKETEYQP